MAVKKIIRVRTKVNTTVNTTPDIDNTLNQMSHLGIDSENTGKIIIQVIIEGGNITTNTNTLEGGLSDEILGLGVDLNDHALASIEGQDNASIRVVFKTGYSLEGIGPDGTPL